MRNAIVSQASFMIVVTIGTTGVSLIPKHASAEHPIIRPPKKLLCSFNQQDRPATTSLPQHFLVQNHAVGSIFCCKGIAAILHAKHHQRFISIVSDGTLAGRRHAHHTAF